MPDMTKKIIHLLHPDQPAEVRCAAALVLGEIGAKDAEIARVLCDCLKDDDPQLRARVIQAVGKLHIEPALPHLLERIKEGGEEAELAAQAAAQFGAKGTRALQELMPKVAPACGVISPRRWRRPAPPAPKPPPSPCCSTRTPASSRPPCAPSSPASPT